MNKTKIIYFVDRPPAYTAYANHPRPKINWDTPDGNWVGIWGTDWANQIGDGILAVNQDYDYEVWQPDYRADKIYEHVFDNGLKHKMFPATKIKHFQTYKYASEWYSRELLDELNKIHENGGKMVIASRLEPSKFNMDLLKQAKNKYPVIGNSLGALDLLFFMYDKDKLPKRIMKKFRYRTDIKALNKFKYLLLIDIFPDWKYKKVQKLFPESKILTWFMGLPSNYLINEKPDKTALRKQFGLPEKSRIFFSSSRLNSLKQVDRIIEGFAPVKEKDFFVIISGSGTKDYVDYLQNLIIKNELTEKIKIYGFVSEEDLIKFYHLSDCFIDASKLDGAPTAGWKAIALGVPVLSTATGNVGEYLRRNSAGAELDRENYSQWTQMFSDFIDNPNINTCDQTEAHKILNWEYCGHKFLNSFKTVIEDFYKNKI